MIYLMNHAYTWLGCTSQGYTKWMCGQSYKSWLYSSCCGLSNKPCLYVLWMQLFMIINTLVWYSVTRLSFDDKEFWRNIRTKRRQTNKWFIRQNLGLEFCWWICISNTCLHACAQNTCACFLSFLSDKEPGQCSWQIDWLAICPRISAGGDDTDG